MRSKCLLIVLAGVLVVALATTALASTVYTVRSGDSLYRIAQLYGTTVDAIKQANQLTGNTIYPGQRLVVPSGGAYTVRSGDTLSGIARAHGVALEDLRRANNLWTDLIYPGQVLVIPAGATGADTTYVVRSGDSLYLIAQRFGVTVTQIRQANNIWTDFIYPGQVLVIPKAGGTAPARDGTSRYTSQELELLARLVHSESAGEPYRGQVAVAATVLNRVRDPRYPNTIAGVIYQVINGIYQYSPVQDGRINLPPSQTSYAAAREALAGSDPSLGANGFYNPAKTRNQWVRQQPVTVVIGNHVFFRH